MSYDKSAAAKQAWVTRRQDWIKTPTFENFKKDFDYWSKTDEGISELKEHQEKDNGNSRYFSKLWRSMYFISRMGTKQYGILLEL